MDEGERIPIDIGAPGEPGAPDLLVSTQADGSIVVDILARPCSMPEEQTDTIMVCAELDETTVARLEASDAPHALQIKLGEHADLTALVQTAPGGIGHQASVRLRIAF